MNEQDIITVGKIGLGISTFLWILCTWRLVFHSRRKLCGRTDREGDNAIRHYHPLPLVSVLPSGTEQQQPQQQQAAPFIRWITRRRAFHSLLWIATLCEVVSYIDISGVLSFTSDRILAENIGYVLLNVAGRTFELLAFCTVTEIWLRTAIDARPRSMHSETPTQNFWLNLLICVFIFFTVLLVLTSASLSVVTFFRYPHAPNRDFVLKMPLAKLQSLLEATCWGIHVLVVAISIGMTSRCILVLVPSTESKRRLYLLLKAVGPMIVSCFVYAMRCGWLIAAYMQQSRRDSWAWWISFAWVPTTTVSVVLLYSTRKRDNVAEDVSMTEDNDNVNNIHMNSNEDLRQSLLRPQPPEEAFRAFQSFRRGDEDADDSFSLGSPQPRNISNAAVAASGEGEEP